MTLSLILKPHLYLLIFQCQTAQKEALSESARNYFFKSVYLNAEEILKKLKTGEGLTLPQIEEMFQLDTVLKQSKTVHYFIHSHIHLEKKEEDQTETMMVRIEVEPNNKVKQKPLYYFYQIHIEES